MNVLICLLGLSPGVATGAYYAFTRDKGITIDRLVTITTTHSRAGDCECEIDGELQESGVQYKGLVILDEPASDINLHDYRMALRTQIVDICRLRISSDDVNNERSVTAFRELVLTLVRDIYRNDNVYLCVAGGRKSMSAITAIAAQLYGYSVRGLYHLFVDSEIEKQGTIENLDYLDDKGLVLCPKSEEVRLVELPFFQITVTEGRPMLALRGQLQDYILDYLADNPELVTVLEPESRSNFLSYMFEVKVCEYLRAKGYTAQHNYYPDGFPDDIDVYAEKDDEILICECQWRDNFQKQPIEAYKVVQIVKRLDFFRERLSADRRLNAWVISPAMWLEDDVNQWPKIRNYFEDHGISIKVKQAIIRQEFVKKIDENKWTALLRDSWILQIDDIEPQS